MESLAEKLGLYDTVGVFFPGVIAIASIELFLPMSIFQHVKEYQNNFVLVSLFLIMSYVVGLILQEVSSILDRKLFKIRETPKQNYLLRESKVLDNEEDRNIYSRMLEKYIKKSDMQCNGSKKEQMQSFYYYCSSFLETKNADGKVKRVSSIYGMSRSLSLFYLLFGLYIQAEEIKYWWVCILLGLLFLNRTYRFSKFKVRVVLRHYRAVKEQKKNGCDVK